MSTLSEEKRRPSGALAADSLTQLAAAGHSLSDVSGAIGAARLEGLAKGLEALGGETAADPDVSAAALTLRAGRSCYRMVQLPGTGSVSDIVTHQGGPVIWAVAPSGTLWRKLKSPE